MADQNLIAYLYPDGITKSVDNAMLTIRMTENESRRIEPLMEDRSRRSSQAPEDEVSNYDDDNDDDDDGYYDQESDEVSKTPNNDYSPGLQLRFDDLRKNGVGFVFGTSRNCDIVLPKRDSLDGIASRLCAITFDDQGRLILRDLQDRKRKKGGTAVTYKGKGGHKRRNFTWILSGDEFTRNHAPIVIALHDNLRFQIVVVQHDIHSALYQENVAQFRHRVDTSVNGLSFSGLGFQSLDSTAAPSGAQTPSTDAILLNNGELGRGAQAVVTRVWDVSTGLEYASKEPLKEKFHKRLMREVNLLKQISHENIVQCIPKLSTATPVPRLVLECVPLGTLAKQKRISSEESLEILRQGLSALRHLHEREDPIVHRDIKPSNILVQSRSPLHIKLSDFGHSKENQDCLKTVCGTQIYTAPEVHKRESYDAAVDIWSLGVVVFQYSHGLPDLDETTEFDGVNCTKIIGALKAKAKSSSCSLLDFLSRAMLVRHPDSRYSARRCQQNAWQLDESQCRCPTPTPASYAQEDEPTLIYNPPRECPVYPPIPQGYYVNEDVEDHQTVLLQGAGTATDLNWRSSSVDGYLTGLTDAERYDRSGAPPPESFVSASAVSRKRISRVSKPPLDRRRAKRQRHSDNAAREVEYFFDEFSNPLHSLYVGSALAEREDSDWDNGTSQTSESPIQRNLSEPVGNRSNESILQHWYQDSRRAEPPPSSHIAPLNMPTGEYGYGCSTRSGDGDVSDQIRYLGNLMFDAGDGWPT